MNLNDVLIKSQLIADQIFKYLDAKSLSYLGACSKSFRSLTNSEIIWKRLCRLKNYEKYLKLLTKQSHSSIPLKSTSSLPTYLNNNELDSIEKINQWHELYNRSEHLKRNWKNGIYFVPPTLKGHIGKITAFDSNGSVIISGCSDDKHLKIWSIEDCECINTIKSKSTGINCLKIYKNLIIVAGDDSVLYIYSFEGDIIKMLSNNKNNSGPITKFIISNDETHLIVVHNDKSIKVWSMKSFEITHILRGHDEEIECILSHNNYILSGSWDRTIILWDINRGKQLIKLTGHTEAVNCFKMNNENIIVSGSSDSIVRIWKLNIIPVITEKNMSVSVELNQSIKLEGHQSDVYCLDIYEKYIVSGGADSLVIVWNFFGELLHKLTGHLGVVRTIWIDDYKCVSGGDAKKIIVWDYKNGKLFNILYRNPTRLNSMIINNDSIITASPEINSTITLILYW